MGIPKFYRWLSERYPLVNQPISEASVPILDNLYLDMNGIIHNCTHGNDPGTKLTEDQMVAKVFLYLERLVSIIQPQKLLFMAIDGVAPRAKMNQQRSRRFKSAKERKEAEAQLIQAGEMVEGEGFDSNCITPGTAFMGRLNSHLRFFIRKKIAEDPLWQRPTIILSGHDVPGEGEHKIMEAIRMKKKAPGYAPNQRHCMYGLDADLIMLSLVTHEPHFCLLREVVSFGGAGKGRPTREVLDNPCAEHFVLFHISLLREYLDQEFGSVIKLPWFNVERVVDDFVLFCMLIGNDFLPALPTLDVNEGALDKIFSIYKKILPELGDYLTNGGELNRPHLERLLQELAALETDTLAQRAADAEDFENKRSRGNRGFGDGRPPGPASAPRASLPPAVSELDEEDAEEVESVDGLVRPVLGDPDVQDLELMVALEGEEEPAAAAPTMMSREARQLFLSNDPDAGLFAWKERYYRDKVGIQDVAGRRAVVESYLTGLLWVLDYYYRGVASWTWFYPYHYSPMCSDLINLDAIRVIFEPGKPFFPFQQLIAVLPAASAELLPKPYKALMTNPNSPIIDFYPETFRIDLEGKRADWEGIVLVPFIDEQRLLAAEATITPDQLTEEERLRNVLGDILIFTYAANAGDREFCTATLDDMANVDVFNSRLVRQPPPPPLAKGEKGFVPELVRGTEVGQRGPAGFPTLKTVTLTCHLAAVGVDVLGQASKKESLVLVPVDHSKGEPNVEQLAKVSVGNCFWIRWPYLVEARVEAVSNAKEKVTREGRAVLKSEEALEWAREADKLQRDYLVKRGVQLASPAFLLHVRPCQGLMRRTDGTIEKRFSKDLVLAAPQVTLHANPGIKDPRLDVDVATQQSATEFRPESKALFVGSYNYGSLATVLSAPTVGVNTKGEALVSGAGMLRVRIDPAPPAAVQAAQTAKRIMASVKVHYKPSYHAARKLGISSRSVGKITGNFFVREGEERTDVGLCVKHGGRNLCVPDYVQAVPDGKGWTYSPALLQVLAEYKKKFPWLFSYMEANGDMGLDCDAGDMLPGLEPAARLEALAEVKKYLKGLPLARRPLVKENAKVAPEDTIRALQMALPAGPSQAMAPIELENVAPWLLLPPAKARSQVTAALAGGDFELGDRVVSLSALGTPPLGYRGTIVGVHDDACEVLFDRDFPGGTDLFGRCSGNCGYLMPGDQLLNTSKPQVITVTGRAAPRIVRKRPSASPAAETAATASTPPPAPTPDPGAGAGTPESRGPVPLAANGATSPLGPSTAAGKASKPARYVLRSPEPRVKVHMPLAPSDPSDRGFTMGRGRPVQAPGSPPLTHVPTHVPIATHNAGQNILQLLNRPAPAPAPTATVESTAAAPAGVAAGRDLLARMRGETAPVAAPTPLWQPAPSPGQLLLASLRAGGGPERPRTPPSPMVPPATVHHSPFGHIRPATSVARPQPPSAPPPGLAPHPLHPPTIANLATAPGNTPLWATAVKPPPGGPAAYLSCPLPSIVGTPTQAVPGPGPLYACPPATFNTPQHAARETSRLFTYLPGSVVNCARRDPLPTPDTRPSHASLKLTPRNTWKGLHLTPPPGFTVLHQPSPYPNTYSQFTHLISGSDKCTFHIHSHPPSQNPNTRALAVSPGDELGPETPRQHLDSPSRRVLPNTPPTDGVGTPATLSLARSTPPTDGARTSSNDGSTGETQAAGGPYRRGRSLAPLVVSFSAFEVTPPTASSAPQTSPFSVSEDTPPTASSAPVKAERSCGFPPGFPAPAHHPTTVFAQPQGPPLPLPAPLTLPCPAPALPRPIMLPRPSALGAGAAQLDKLLRGKVPTGLPPTTPAVEPGRALLAKLQAHAPQTSAPYVVNGVESVANTQSSSEGQSSPGERNGGPGNAAALLNDAAVVKARIAAKTALRGAKETVLKVPANEQHAELAASAQAHLAQAHQKAGEALKGLLGVGARPPLGPPPNQPPPPTAPAPAPVIDVEASIRAREAAAAALKGLLNVKPVSPTSPGRAEAHAPLPAPATATPAAGGAPIPATTTSPAEFWKQLMR